MTFLNECLHGNYFHRILNSGKNHVGRKLRLHNLYTDKIPV